jgi:tripartite-type tricarboxylate transporter receptor subunit TctC
MPDTRQRLASQGADVVASTPDEFAAYIKSETERWAKVIKSAGIRAE